LLVYKECLAKHIKLVITFKKERMNKKLTNECGFEDPDFWNNLTKGSDILKWNPSGEYDKTFTAEYKHFLDCFHDLPVPSINVGDVVMGKISSINTKEIVIDVNYKDSVFVDIKGADLKITQKLNKGDDINVMITSVEDNPYEIKGSITELIKIEVANKLRSFYRENTSLLAHVTETIPAGFMLDIEMDNINITAFMPNTLAGVNRLTPNQSGSLVGSDISVMLETLQQEKGVYVVSRKKYLQSLIPLEIEKIKADRLVDAEKVYTGTVTGTKDFGVFIEFNDCLTGMIHKVNLNPAFQDKITEIESGTVIDFYVRDVLKGDKIILTQILRESLWDTIRVGQIKEGTVRVVKPFGALIALDDETTGLVQNTYIEKSGKSLTKGDKVQVKIVSVIKDDRKIYLDFPRN